MGSDQAATEHRAAFLRDIWSASLEAARASRCIIIASTFRSGSTYVATRLAEHGYDGLDLERFNQAWKLRTDPLPIAENMLREIAAATSTTGSLNFKLMWPHRTYLAQALGIRRADSAAFRELFPNATWIHVRRRDKFAQAISFWRAKRTGRWHVYADEAEPEVEYDFPAIMACLRELELDDNLWSDFFAIAGMEPVVLDYEDVLADVNAALMRLLPQLGAPTHSPRAGNLKRQSDHVSDELRARLLEDLFNGRHLRGDEIH